MRILHVLRSPIGGLYRHVSDLAAAQTQLGHDVGVVCSTEDSLSISNALKALEPKLKLGLHRLPMQRLPHPNDLNVIRNIRKIVNLTNTDVVHGHGAKGGLYSRFSTRTNVYTPHGGSLHFNWHQMQGALFLATEKLLAARTNGYVFVCQFEKREFESKIGKMKMPAAVIYNGLQEADFKIIPPNFEAGDFLFVGEMRKLKGVDVLLRALALLKSEGSDMSAIFVGDGPELSEFQKLADELGLAEKTQFVGRLPFQSALALGKTIVLPSRAESFPYVVLESIAAGRILIASDVGGIGEILPPDFLVPCDNPVLLAKKLGETIGHQKMLQENIAETRKKAYEHFTVIEMAKAAIYFYKSLRTGA